MTYTRTLIWESRLSCDDRERSFHYLFIFLCKHDLWKAKFKSSSSLRDSTYLCWGLIEPHRSFWFKATSWIFKTLTLFSKIKIFLEFFESNKNILRFSFLAKNKQKVLDEDNLLLCSFIMRKHILSCICLFSNNIRMFSMKLINVFNNSLHYNNVQTAIFVHHCHSAKSASLITMKSKKSYKINLKKKKKRKKIWFDTIDTSYNKYIVVCNVRCI